MKTLQIVFCILACLGVAAATFMGVFLGLEYAIIGALFAILCAMGMYFVRARTQKPPKKRDFMDPPSEEGGDEDGPEK